MLWCRGRRASVRVTERIGRIGAAEESSATHDESNSEYGYLAVRGLWINSLG